MKKPKREPRPKREKKQKVVRQHTRKIDSVTGPLERRSLAWFAARMPQWVTPDILTGIGILGAAFCGLGYFFSNRNPVFLWLAVLGWFLNWFGDSLDGTIARYRHIERPLYGFFLDHSMDAVSTIIILVGLGLSPYVSFDLATFVLVGYLLMIIYAALATYTSTVFQISYGYLGPTEARILAIFCTIGAFIYGGPVIYLPTGNLTLLGILAVILGCVLFTMFFISTYSQAVKLARLENPANQNPAKVSPSISPTAVQDPDVSSGK